MKKYILPLILYFISMIVCSLFLCALLPPDSLTSSGKSSIEILTGDSWLINLFVFISSFYAAIKSLQKL